jgi:hypothetical protein
LKNGKNISGIRKVEQKYEFQKMKLTDNIWSKLEGGYKVPYDVSVPLRELEKTTDSETIQKIWKTLWDELHHQGDVGLASYLAVPQLVAIGKSKGLFDWNLLGLCNVIEQQRHLGSNPSLPSEFQDYYYQGLDDLKQFVLDNINNNLDDTTYTLALSTLATCAGRIKLGKAIMELEDNSIIDEFLEQF